MIAHGETQRAVQIRHAAKLIQHEVYPTTCLPNISLHRVRCCVELNCSLPHFAHSICSQLYFDSTPLFDFILRIFQGRDVSDWITSTRVNHLCSKSLQSCDLYQWIGRDSTLRRVGRLTKKIGPKSLLRKNVGRSANLWGVS